MNISNGIIKVLAIAVMIFGAFVLFTTNFSAFDLAFALHFIGGLVLIGAGVVLIRGGNITL